MGKTASYRQVLETLDTWDEFLLRESGLPGPRANLELIQAVADLGDAALFERFLHYGPEIAPTNDPHEFLAACGVVGLGKLLAEGNLSVLETLRHCAADPRWRIREAVCMALQRWGDVDRAALFAAVPAWGRGSLWERRAAAAAVCESRLLTEAAYAQQALDLLDAITASLAEVAERKDEAFRVLRQGLAYCWSVAVVALPEAGKPLMEKWAVSDDPDVRWILRENFKKARLARMDAAWVEAWRAKV